MRVPGYCEKCHKIRTVTVRIPMPGAAQIGICDRCAELRLIPTKERR